MFSDVLFILLVSAGIAYALVALACFVLVFYFALRRDGCVTHEDGRPAGILPRIFLITMGLVVSIIWPIVFVLGREKSGKAQ